MDTSSNLQGQSLAAAIIGNKDARNTIKDAAKDAGNAIKSGAKKILGIP